jgi:hypothetical protein
MRCSATTRASTIPPADSGAPATTRVLSTRHRRMATPFSNTTGASPPPAGSVLGGNLGATPTPPTEPCAFNTTGVTKPPADRCAPDNNRALTPPSGALSNTTAPHNTASGSGPMSAGNPNNATSLSAQEPSSPAQGPPGKHFCHGDRRAGGVSASLTRPRRKTSSRWMEKQCERFAL